MAAMRAAARAVTMLIVAERPITRSGEACDEAFLVDALTKDWTGLDGDAWISSPLIIQLRPDAAFIVVCIEYACGQTLTVRGHRQYKGFPTNRKRICGRLGRSPCCTGPSGDSQFSQTGEFAVSVAFKSKTPGRMERQVSLRIKLAGGQQTRTLLAVLHEPYAANVTLGRSGADQNDSKGLMKTCQDQRYLRDAIRTLIFAS
ncbi:hypothetical protein AAL_07964 [Moelleriella libera RCEF 2490]|uniref:Uncharacterized protein n=1 Tax=Moelleriella libera RCEF 2490 TaxID=1081109 RepID=A0A162I567_9HYPO|nr:hypothetical protein AAL_07964 [Moelleriella libera RCEF 2490]